MFEINGKIRKKITKRRYNYFVEIFLVLKSSNPTLLPNVSAVEVHFVFSRNSTSSMAISLNAVLPTTPSNITYSKQKYGLKNTLK